METKTFKEKLNYIGSKKMLRVERWKDKYGHWRAGIEWYGKDKFEFVCKKPTLEECLDLIIKFMDGKLT